MTDTCQTKQRPKTPVAADTGVSLRRWPYPYKAALAICSDLDETPDRHVYWEIMRFLNTFETTSMGAGVGLEVGNSIYFDMPPDQFAYWNTDDAGREMVRTLIRSGHIDCLHSYGDLATQRSHARRALEELERHDCRLKVWVDHSKAPTNFGRDIMCGSGDVPESPAYHADLTCAFGIRYVSRGRATSVIGQDVPARMRDVFTPRHPVASGKTIAKETAKRWLAAAGNEKYAMHGPNRAFRSARLRDGSPVYEFLRCNPHWRGTGCGATAAGIAEVLNHGFLDRLTRRKGGCILYTHLGKEKGPDRPFGKKTCEAFEGLAKRFHDEEILVATTARTLDYLCIRNGLRWSSTVVGDTARIEIGGVDDGIRGFSIPAVSELAGLSFVADGASHVEVRLQGVNVPIVQDHSDDGKIVASLPFGRLEFPSL